MIEVSHCSYLDTFLVNGRPIGDCTVEEAEASAQARKLARAFPQQTALAE